MKFLGWSVLLLLMGCTLSPRSQHIYARGSDVFTIYQSYGEQYLRTGWQKTYEKMYTDTIEATYCNSDRCENIRIETRGYSGVFTVTITP